MRKNKAQYVGTTEAGELLGFCPDHVRRLILSGKIPAEKVGANWIINKDNLASYSRQRWPRIKEVIQDGSGNQSHK